MGVETALHKKWSFPLNITLVNVFTEEILNGRHHFLCSAGECSMPPPVLPILQNLLFYLAVAFICLFIYSGAFVSLMFGELFNFW